MATKRGGGKPAAKAAGPKAEEKPVETAPVADTPPEQPPVAQEQPKAEEKPVEPYRSARWRFRPTNPMAIPKEFVSSMSPLALNEEALDAHIEKAVAEKKRVPIIAGLVISEQPKPPAA